MSTRIEIRHKGFSVFITKRTVTKGGKQYLEYSMPDYSSGQRVRHVRAKLEDAKRKAHEICEANLTGQTGLLILAPYERAIQAALEALTPTSTRLDKACFIFADACKLVEPHEIIEACRFWREHRPGGTFVPKIVDAAVDEYLARLRGEIRARRHRTETSYLTAFQTKFGERQLSEIEAIEIKDWAKEKGWSKVTFNDVLAAISRFFKDAKARNYAAVNPAEAQRIDRFKIRGSTVEILMPGVARKIMNSIEDELKPFLALWLWSGARKEEASKLSWDQIGAGLESGSIFLRAEQAKTGFHRSLPISGNLRAWLMAYRKPSGPVLPARWISPDPNRQMDLLAYLQRHMARKAKIKWVKNGPRHSFGTFHLKVHGDPASTINAMGTSLEKLNRYYASRLDTVTQEAAKAWFDIFPSGTAEVIPMPEAAPAAG